MVVLTLFTQNCWLIPVMMPSYGGIIDEYVNDRAQLLIDNVFPAMQADVMMLQEVWSQLDTVRILNVGKEKFARDKIIDYLLTASGPYYEFVSKSQGSSWWRQMDSGLVTASKFRVLHEEFYLYPIGGFTEDRLASKGVYATVLQLDADKKICVVAVNTHLEANVDSVRFKQLDHALKFVDHINNYRINRVECTTVATVLAGDFNFDGLAVEPPVNQDGKTFLKIMEENKYTDATGDIIGPTWFDGSKPNGRYDFIWLKGSVKVKGGTVTGAEMWTEACIGGESDPLLVEKLRHQKCATDHAGIKVTMEITEQSQPSSPLSRRPIVQQPLFDNNVKFVPDRTYSETNGQIAVKQGTLSANFEPARKRDAPAAQKPRFFTGSLWNIFSGGSNPPDKQESS